MQRLQTATKPAVPVQSDDCAGQVLDTIPVLMRLIREQMRQHRRSELSVPQFRSLIFVHHTPEATLSDLAEHLGLSLPAASRLVAGLVTRSLMLRQQRKDNRRCVRLSLTARGRAAFQAAFKQTRLAFAERLTSLSNPQLRLVSQAMQLLNQVFESSGAAEAVPPHSKNPTRGVSTK
jgi:MarR family transcriptional regulator for hemolysin